MGIALDFTESTEIMHSAKTTILQHTNINSAKRIMSSQNLTAHFHANSIHHSWLDICPNPFHQTTTRKSTITTDNIFTDHYHIYLTKTNKSFPHTPHYLRIRSTHQSSSLWFPIALSNYNTTGPLTCLHFATLASGFLLRLRSEWCRVEYHVSHNNYHYCHAAVAIRSVVRKINHHFSLFSWCQRTDRSIPPKSKPQPIGNSRISAAIKTVQSFFFALGTLYQTQ